MSQTGFSVSEHMQIAPMQFRISSTIFKDFPCLYLDIIFIKYNTFIPDDKPRPFISSVGTLEQRIFGISASSPGNTEFGRSLILTENAWLLNPSFTASKIIKSISNIFKYWNYCCDQLQYYQSLCPMSLSVPILEPDLQQLQLPNQNKRHLPHSE